MIFRPYRLTWPVLYAHARATAKNVKTHHSVRIIRKRRKFSKPEYTKYTLLVMDIKSL